MYITHTMLRCVFVNYKLWWCFEHHSVSARLHVFMLSSVAHVGYIGNHIIKLVHYIAIIKLTFLSLNRIEFSVISLLLHHSELCLSQLHMFLSPIYISFYFLRFCTLWMCLCVQNVNDFNAYEFAQNVSSNLSLILINIRTVYSILIYVCQLLADGFYVLFATRFDLTLKIIQNVHMANDNGCAALLHRFS